MEKNKLTIRLSTLRSRALADLAVVLEVEVPALLLATGVLEVESNNSLGLADGVLTLSLVGLESRVDHVERGGGRELVCWGTNFLVSDDDDARQKGGFWVCVARSDHFQRVCMHVPFLRDIMGGYELVSG